MTDPHRGQRVLRLGPPPGERGAAVIMIHGRNAAPENILDLASRLDRPAVSYYAPAAANNTWYPFSFMAEFSQNEPWLTSALGAVGNLLERVAAEGCPPERTVLLGFSQGACLAAEYVCRHPGKYGGLVVFSGGLIGPPGTQWNRASTLDGTPVFLGCSDIDAHVPKTRVDESARVFERMNAVVTERIYPGMGHLVNEDEIAWARDLIDQIHA